METMMLKAQIEFFTKFGQMLTSGIPIASSLEILMDECSCPSLKEELLRTSRSISGGRGFTMAETGVFSRFTKEMISSGEKHGNLDLICMRIGLCLEKELETRLDSRRTLPGSKAKAARNAGKY